MRLENFNYKPRCITQIEEKDFREEGIVFEDILKGMACSKFEAGQPIPDISPLRMRIGTMDQHCIRLATFYFQIGSNYSDYIHPSIELKFPYHDLYRREQDTDRAPNSVFYTRAFPNSIDYAGYTVGNYHLDVLIKDLFEEHTQHHIMFDEDGNYIPVLSNENSCDPTEVLKTLRYTPEEWPNPTNLDKMLIPELCNAKIGKYFFWLDRFHFAKVYEKDKNPVSTGMNYRKVLEVYSMNCYNDTKSWDKNLTLCRQVIEKEEGYGPFAYPVTGIRYFKSLASIYLCDDGNLMIGCGHNDDDIGNMATIRRRCIPVVRKALEIYEILNNDPERFSKQAIFPESFRKIADTLSPLIAKTTQIIRTCKSIQLEEI